MKVGDCVVAVEQIVEENFLGARLHIHAEKGDVGRVVHINGLNLPTVRFIRTRTATLCGLNEVVVQRAAAVPATQGETEL